MQLGRLGAWYSTDKLGGPKDIATFASNVERLGYATLWYPESRGYESFSVAGFMLGATKTLKIGSSIASIYARDAFTSRRGMISLNALYGDRFILGLGVSHMPMVEGVRGHTYSKPIPVMRAYLDGICKGQPGAEDWPVAVAALGPLMLKLAGEKTRGALPYNVTPEHTARAAKIMGPGKWLAMDDKHGTAFVQTLETKLQGLASVVEQSGGLGVLRLAGPALPETLEKGVQIDLAPGAFPVGSVAVTSIAHIGVTLWKVDAAPTIEIAVARSLAGSFFHWLELSASAHGLSKQHRPD